MNKPRPKPRVNGSGMNRIIASPTPTAVPLKTTAARRSPSCERSRPHQAQLSAAARLKLIAATVTSPRSHSNLTTPERGETDREADEGSDALAERLQATFRRGMDAKPTGATAREERLFKAARAGGEDAFRQLVRARLVDACCRARCAPR
jgi:hypothetical protein